MFFGEDTRGERVGRVVVQHRHDALRDDGAAVQSFVHEVNRAARPLDAVIERLPLRVKAGKRWQQGRMNVDDAPAPREFIATNGEMRWVVEQPLTPQQREATEKLMLALQVASAKFNYAQREMREIGRAAK